MDLSPQNLLVLLLASFPICFYAYPNGQVTDSCVSMTPSHGAAAQTSSPPYTLSLDKTTYSSGDNIKVTLSSNSGAPQFKGFLIQARSGSSTTPVGSFVTSNSNTQTLTCTSAASSVSQTSGSGKSSIDVTWVAPASGSADIQISASVVQTEKVFWTNVASAKITFVSSNSTSNTPGNTGGTTSQTTGSNSGAQRTWTLQGLLLSCIIVMASFMA
ncbi:putative ferric-chelate reductase 1 [Hyla sarda]|uniref:putative ferric-chelate reductase 1 n=1 Tax=Hyla sarda TaxID=327740 RepID=UPI0024C3CD98|nr:putative ferric-chelate reductase 1 [Hyla sarda]